MPRHRRCYAHASYTLFKVNKEVIENIQMNSQLSALYYKEEIPFSHKKTIHQIWDMLRQKDKEEHKEKTSDKKQNA